jgi:hypothetical protein
MEAIHPILMFALSFAAGALAAAVVIDAIHSREE